MKSTTACISGKYLAARLEKAVLIGRSLSGTAHSGCPNLPVSLDIPGSKRLISADK
jgi:hypothetical protein